jgi:exo-beta-1,3-glucanase (GH17 family)
MHRPVSRTSLWLCACLALAGCSRSTKPTNQHENPSNGDGDGGDGDTSGDGDHTGNGDGDKPGDGDGDKPGDGDADAGTPGDGDGDKPSGDGDVDGPQVDDEGHRLIPKSVLARRAICYSGYRTGQSPDAQSYPSEEQILEDLELVTQSGFGLIRLFDSSAHAERTLKVIKDNKLDIKATLGIWIAGGKADHDAENQADIERGVKLANDYQGIVVGVSVGNETLDYWSSVLTPAADLVEYLKEVRGRVTQPVTTDDLYPPFLMSNDDGHDYGSVLEVIKAADYLSVHIYPFLDAPWGSWEWKLESVPVDQRPRAMMDAAFAYATSSMADVKSAIEAKGIHIPILIGEAGWKDKTSFGSDTGDQQHSVEPYFSSPVNQKWIYDDFDAWIYGDKKDDNSPLALFWFEAFDEPWKEGDDNWGLFDVNRKAKWAVWSRVPALKPAGAHTPSDGDAICWGK